MRFVLGNKEQSPEPLPWGRGQLAVDRTQAEAEHWGWALAVAPGTREPVGVQLRAPRMGHGAAGLWWGWGGQRGAQAPPVWGARPRPGLGTGW